MLLHSAKRRSPRVVSIQRIVKYAHEVHIWYSGGGANPLIVPANIKIDVPS